MRVKSPSNWKRGDPHQAFVRGQYTAKRKGVYWSLSEAQFFALYLKPCVYCRFTFLRGWGTGLDQKLPGAGYTKENSVPCCAECNRIKSNRYTYQEMKKLGRVLRGLRKARGES